MTSWISLSGSQQQRLQSALLSSFDLPSLQRLLSFRLEVSLYNVVSPGPAQDVVFGLVNVATQEGWLDDLIVAVSEARAGHPELEQIKTELGIGKSISATSATALESFVKGVGGLLDPEVFRTNLAKAESAVCRINYLRPNGQPYGGTGFLVGPDLVMTNYHVMKYAINRSVPSSGVKVVFDYKLDGTGNTVNEGNSFGLAAEWLVEHSPYSQSDLQPIANVPDTPFDELDFALIRLDQEVGCQPVSTNLPGRAAGHVVEGDSARGWIDVPDEPATIEAHAPLLILQHPQIGMMKLAWDPEGVLAVNASKTRIRHATATLPGSSGSPCFDSSFNIVALHHAGDPAETMEIPANYNQAVPMTAIVSLLAKRGRLGVLNEKCPVT